MLQELEESWLTGNSTLRMLNVLSVLGAGGPQTTL
jgi:hypothetical protein